MEGIYEITRTPSSICEWTTESRKETKKGKKWGSSIRTCTMEYLKNVKRWQDTVKVINTCAESKWNWQLLHPGSCSEARNNKLHQKAAAIFCSIPQPWQQMACEPLQRDNITTRSNISSAFVSILYTGKETGLPDTRHSRRTNSIFKLADSTIKQFSSVFTSFWLFNP
jgi:hypothetical protein